MKWTLAGILFAIAPPAMAAQARVPLYDSIGLNIGINCHWQQKCIQQQQRAMTRALTFVRKQQPPVWRVQLCNRNASRGRNRVDWVGFDNCIRNAALRPASTRQVKRRRLTLHRARLRDSPIAIASGSAHFASVAELPQE